MKGRQVRDGQMLLLLLLLRRVKGTIKRPNEYVWEAANKYLYL